METQTMTIEEIKKIRKANPKLIRSLPLLYRKVVENIEKFEELNGGRG